MAEKDSPDKLRALPLQLIEIADAVVVKRGCSEVKITGSGAADLLRFILASTANEGASREEISQKFPIMQRPVVDQLIQHLADRRFLTSGNSNGSSIDILESHQDVFYWHFGESSEQVARRVNSKSIVIIGVNYISLQLSAALLLSGWDNFQIMDDPRLRNLRLFDEGGTLSENKSQSFPKGFEQYNDWIKTFDPKTTHCLIATSDFGNCPTIQEWNRFSVGHGCHFLPIILHNLIGYIGPLVVPGETACYECLRLRQNSHVDNPDINRLPEQQAFEGQVIIGFHPAMASVLGDIAACELSKFYGGILPSRTAGTLIEVNLLSTQLTSRKVLKVPRCPVCTPLKQRSSVSTVKDALSSPPDNKS